MSRIQKAVTPIKLLSFLLVVVMAAIAVNGSGTVVASSSGKSYSYNTIGQDVTPTHNLNTVNPVTDSTSEDLTKALVPDTDELSEQADEGFIYCSQIALSEELQRFTYERCKELDLDYSIVLALIWRESGFNPHAIGYNSNGTRDHGIMQINDVNINWLSRELGLNNLMDPKENITAGTEMLSRFTEKYGLNNGLMAYQHGEQGMLNKVRRGATTDSQVQLVYTKSSEFESIIDNSKISNI